MRDSWRNATIDPRTGRLRIPTPRTCRRPAADGWPRDLAGQVRHADLTIADDGTITIRLPYRLESPNKLLHAHWRARHDDKVAWRVRLTALIAVHAVALHDRGLLPQDDRRTVRILREVASGRGLIRDRENLVYSVKFLVDRIRECGLIRDDSMKWIRLEVDQAVSRDRLDTTQIVIGPW